LKGKHLSELITDKAINYISRQKDAAPEKPFFLYYAPGATHAPHQVAAKWSDAYKGKFDEGWDVYREKVIANQKKLGIIPANAKLPDRNPTVKEWKSLSADEKKLYAKFMEVYAGYLSYTDYEVSRLVNHLKEINQLDNTIFFVILGDNGASKEGTYLGTIDEPLLKRAFSGASEESNLANNLAKIDAIGTAKAIEGNYPLGWAQATNTPFRNWKQDAHSEGGTRNPLIVYYPKGIQEKGGIRNQYGHVIDILPTTLEYIGLSTPTEIKGIAQDPIQGTSLVYSFADAKAPSQHNLQYYYIFGSRALYKDGWKAAAIHHPDFIDITEARASGKKPVKSDILNDTWELYNLNTDFNERIDLAKKYPEKLKELQEEFHQQALKNNIYPLINWEDVLNLRIHKKNQ
jgi:arylsulfatase A-like enzyme